MRNLLDDSTMWVKVRRQLLLTSLVYAIASTALGQQLPTEDYQSYYKQFFLPKNELDRLRDSMQNTSDTILSEDSDTSALSMHVSGDKAEEKHSIIIQKEIIHDDPMVKVLTVVVIVLQLASILILLYYRVKPKRDSNGKGERDAKNEEPNEEINNLNSVIEDWRLQTGCESPKDAKKYIDDLKNQCVNTQKGKKSHEKEFETFQERVKNNPESFEGDREYKKLAELITKAQKCDSLSDNPSLIGAATVSGKLIAAGKLLETYLNDPQKVTTGVHSTTKLAVAVKKSIFLDKAKDDLGVVLDDSMYVANSELQKAVSCIEEPYKILRTNLNAFGLYKLVSDLNIIADAVRNSKEITEKAITSDEMKDKLKPVMDGLVRYQKFGIYQNYWSNIQRPLFDVLNNLHNHDDLYNMRALMFYCSQFLSIAETFRNIYKGNTNSRVYDWNVALFNNATAPSIGNYGIPDISDGELENFKFKYRGAQDEDDRRDYFNRFAPMRFILISTYYN